MKIDGFKNLIKFNLGVRKVYRRVGSFFLKGLGVFIPIKSKRALFMCYGGRQYSDSPKALYEAMVADPFFEDWELSWAFNDPSKHSNLSCGLLRADTPKYFTYALSSRVWITNSSIGRGLQFKKRNTIAVNTWHGCPLKKMGYSLDPNPKYRGHVDIGCCQSDYDRNILLRILDVRKEDLLQVDLPRNDSLLTYTTEDVLRIRRKLGIADDKKVLMYMPTYRDYNLDAQKRNFLLPPIDLSRWYEELGQEWVLLVRFHHLIDEMMELPNTPFVVNVTGYEELNDLYAITDCLISDYSSSYVDYSILGRPMLCFGYDFEEYRDWRGFEIDFEREMPCRIDRTEDELLQSIKALDVEEASSKTRAFRDRFAPNAGHATEAVVAELKRRLEQ